MVAGGRRCPIMLQVKQVRWLPGGPLLSVAFAPASCRGSPGRSVCREGRGKAAGGVRQALNPPFKPLLELQQRLLENSRDAGVKPEEVPSALMAIQDILLTTLAGRYDALDAAAGESELPFCRSRPHRPGRLRQRGVDQAHPANRSSATFAIVVRRGAGAAHCRRPGGGKVCEPARRA